MKQIICGIATTAVVLVCGVANGACSSCASCSSCGSSCANCGTKTQTIRITAGNRTTQAIVRTDQDGTGGAMGIAVPVPAVGVGVNGVGGTVGGDIVARAPSGYAVQNDSGEQRFVTPVNSGVNGAHVASDNRRQPINYQRSNYQGTDYQPQPNDNTFGTLYDDYYVDGNDAPRYGWNEYDNYKVSKHDAGGMWYVGAHLDLNLLSWKNKYRATPIEAVTDPDADHDDYKFKPVIGGNVFAGYRFDSHWRTDLEFGFTSSYSDSGAGITFELSVPYLTANGYYGFENGLYLGAGLGMAFPTVSMEWAYYTGGDSDKTKTVFTAAGMVGYSYYLSESLVLDLRLRVSAMDGPSITRGVSNYIVNGVALQSLETEVSTIWNTAVSVGFKYEF